MSVNPGFGGQAFKPQVLKKISILRKKFSGLIQVDGGINDKTARLVARAGADILVAGSYIFKAKNRKNVIGKLKNV